MIVKTFTAAVNGLNISTVTIEVSATPAEELRFHLSGLGDSAVRESRDRVWAAVRHSGYSLPSGNVTVNMSPANLRKEGSGFDLPLAVALIAAAGELESTVMGSTILVGELSLDGTLRAVKGALPIALRAKSEGFRAVVLPQENVREAAVVDGLGVYGIATLRDVVEFLRHPDAFQPIHTDAAQLFADSQADTDLDFADVRGQDSVKRALEVAAAGGHNLIMIGPPGSGKSMMAKRLPSILPPLTMAESLETTQIHSVAGKVQHGVALITRRPFRAPHHTISEAALVGGGSTPQPGEISLAHNGVLFADELPEFNKHTLEVLRQPLEDKRITIARAKYSLDYPCNFMLVAAMNPCPCGYYGDPTHRCDCSPQQIQRYMGKISGPLLDRIDIQCEITPVPFKDLSSAAPGEPSAAIRQRVIAARERQAARYKGVRGVHCNAQMSERQVHQFAEPDDAGREMLRLAMDRLALSARAYNRILKVARTIADLAASDRVGPAHIAEAVSYRQLDRADWAERRAW